MAGWLAKKERGRHKEDLAEASFIGLSGVSAFAPAGVARVGSTGLCMSAGGSGKIKQVSDIRQDPRKKLAPAGQARRRWWPALRR
eukprot:758053-Hanusia_phi.AAC.2